MKRSRHQRMTPGTFRILFTAALVLADSAVAYSVILAGYELRIRLLESAQLIPPRHAYEHLALFFTVTNLYFMCVFGMYSATRIRSGIDECFGVGKSVTVTLSIVMALTFFYRDFEYSRLTAVMALFLGFAMLGASRLIMLWLEFLFLKLGFGRKKALFIGSGDMLDPLARKITQNPNSGYDIIGYIEEEPGSGLVAAPLIGRLDEMEIIVNNDRPNEIFVTLKPAWHGEVEKIVDLCDRCGIDCILAPDMVGMMAGPRRFDQIEGFPLIRVKHLRIRGFNFMLKRSLDVTLSLFSMILFSPLFIMIALLVKLDSPGPIFYLQKRVGMDGVDYWMFKFRTMPSNVEGGTPAWSKKQDPRATRVGRLLRASSMDELPQLINVLIGQMSLVGPRPERPFFVDRFRKDVRRYMERHKVKAGMTGWSQVNGLRGDTSMEERIRHDMYYIENWSLFFDMKILILTFRTILIDLGGFFVKFLAGGDDNDNKQSGGEEEAEEEDAPPSK